MLAGLWEEAGGAGLAHPTAGLTVAGAHSGGPPSEFPAVCGELGLPASGAERRGRVVIVKHDAAATGWAEGRHEPAPLSLLAGPSVHLRPRETPPHPPSLTLGWAPRPCPGSHCPGRGCDQTSPTKDARWVGQSGKVRPRDGASPGPRSQPVGRRGPEPPPNRPSVPLLEPQRGIPCALTAPLLNACPRGVVRGLQQGEW